MNNIPPTVSLRHNNTSKRSMNALPLALNPNAFIFAQNSQRNLNLSLVQIDLSFFYFYSGNKSYYSFIPTMFLRKIVPARTSSLFLFSLKRKQINVPNLLKQPNTKQLLPNLDQQITTKIKTM